MIVFEKYGKKYFHIVSRAYNLSSLLLSVDSGSTPSLMAEIFSFFLLSLSPFWRKGGGRGWQNKRQDRVKAFLHNWGDRSKTLGDSGLVLSFHVLSVKWPHPLIRAVFVSWPGYCFKMCLIESLTSRIYWLAFWWKLITETILLIKFIA